MGGPIEGLLKGRREQEARREKIAALSEGLTADSKRAVGFSLLKALPTDQLHEAVADLLQYVDRVAANAAKRSEGSQHATSKPSLSTAPRTRQATKKRQRDYIAEALAAARRPMSSTEIARAVIAVRGPEAKEASIRAEIQRMRKEGQLIAISTDGRGSLYGLAPNYPGNAELIQHAEDLNGASAN